jgi:hypothetical protein
VGLDEFPKAQDGVMKKFKRLLQSLSITGDLPEGQILKEASQYTTSMAFLAKVMTFDISSPTERMLYKLIDAYKVAYPDTYQIMEEQGHIEFFESDAFRNTIMELQLYYKDNGLLSEDDMPFIQENLERLAEVVKFYMSSQGDFEVPEKVYMSSFQPTFFALFSSNAQVTLEEQMHLSKQQAQTVLLL